MKTLILIFSFINLSFFTLMAQDIEADLLKMKETYSQLENLAIQIHIEMDLELENAFPVEETYLYKKGNSFFVKMGSIEQIKNERCRLVIHHDEKQLGYHPSEATSIQDILTDSFESMLQQRDLSDFTFIEEKNGQKLYRLEREEAMIQEMDLYINANNFLLEKLVYQYHPKLMGEDQTVTILYEYDFNPSFEKANFDETTFVYWQDDELQLQTRYQAYNLTQLNFNNQ